MQKGEVEQAVEMALQGEMYGTGVITDNLSFLHKYYCQQQDYDKALEYLIKKFKASPDYGLFTSVLDYCKEEQRHLVRKELMEYLHSFTGWQKYQILTQIYFDEQDFDKIINLVLKGAIYPGKYEEMLVQRYPKEMIGYYHSYVNQCINRENRKSYQEWAGLALKIKAIYLNVLKSPMEWKIYITGILRDYPRHKALQEEFKKCL